MPPNSSNPYNSLVNPSVKPSTFTPSPATPIKPATPPPPPTPTQPQAPKGDKRGEKKALLPALVVLLVLVAAYAWYQHGGSISNPLSSKFSSENVSIGEVNVAEGQTEGLPLPEAFPSDFPIVIKNITQQNVLHYPDRNVDLYSVTYTSKLQPEELYATYNTYFGTKHYNVLNYVKTATQMSFEAERNGNNYTVMITPEVDGATVNIAVIDRK